MDEFFLSVLLTGCGLPKYECFFPIASATSWHFGSREGGAIRKDRGSYDAAVTKAQGIAFVYQKNKRSALWSLLGMILSQLLTGIGSFLKHFDCLEWFLATPLLPYCSLTFYNICRKCWTNVWMKKGREARRLWQLLQRYLSLIGR